MNSLFNWAENVIQDFNIWDIAVMKLCLFSIGLIVGAYISVFVKKRIWWAAAAVLSGAWLAYKMFSRFIKAQE